MRTSRANAPRGGDGPNILSRIMRPFQQIGLYPALVEREQRVQCLHIPLRIRKQQQ